MPTVAIQEIDEERRLVTGVVYQPYVLDTFGTMMLPQAIERLAHEFVALMRTSGDLIDTNHDQISNGSYPVESWIARAGDPTYPEGAWVMTTKVVGDKEWEDVKAGRLNGYSFEILAKQRLALVDYVLFTSTFGETEEADGHRHFYYLEYDGDGRVVGGRTSTAKDSRGVLHSHELKHGTVTRPTRGHTHRFNASS